MIRFYTKQKDITHQLLDMIFLFRKMDGIFLFSNLVKFISMLLIWRWDTFSIRDIYVFGFLFIYVFLKVFSFINFKFFQVFDVVLNGDLTIASDLDVFERVGRGVAHDEYIEFEVKSGKILFEGDETEITRGKMRVEFIKVLILVHPKIANICYSISSPTIIISLIFLQSYRDNPKVNAIILIKGKLSGKLIRDFYI